MSMIETVCSCDVAVRKCSRLEAVVLLLWKNHTFWIFKSSICSGPKIAVFDWSFWRERWYLSPNFRVTFSWQNPVLSPVVETELVTNLANLSWMSAFILSFCDCLSISLDKGWFCQINSRRRLLKKVTEFSKICPAFGLIGFLKMFACISFSLIF